MKVYIFAEHTSRAGDLANDAQVERLTGEDGTVSDDLVLWGEGSEEDLVAEAVRDLAVPCSLAPHFRHTCARAVLSDLGGPTVEPHHDPARGSFWLPTAHALTEAGFVC